MAVLLTFATSCSGSSGKTNTNGTGPTAGSGAPPKSGELDKLMRTRMNVSYSQLVYLVFHAEGGPDFDAISTESAKLSEAVNSVLSLQPPPIVQSDQARSVYVDYNETLRRDNEKFVAATASRNIESMSTSLTKIGETCSACHHFFRIEIK
jgi:cytochrome c556